MKDNRTELVMIGGSAGSLQVILELVRKLDADLDFPIVGCTSEGSVHKYFADTFAAVFY